MRAVQVRRRSCFRPRKQNLGQTAVFSAALHIFESAADLQPSMEDYNAFMKQWGEENEKRTEQIVQTYPDIRTITGEYLLRKITIK